MYYAKRAGTPVVAVGDAFRAHLLSSSVRDWNAMVVRFPRTNRPQAS